MSSWAAEVLVMGEKEYVPNGLRFATKDEAMQYAGDLGSRWHLVTDYRAVPSDEPVNFP